MADINVVSRRAGGGFGGKLCRHIPVAVAAAVAAQHTGKPVRMTLDRNTDMRTTGGRHAVDVNFEAGYNDDGKIVALKLEIYMNCGFNPDLSDFCVMSIAKAVDQVYRFDDLEITAHACRTNLPTRGAVRGPGEIQASFVIEDVVEKVAAALHAARHPHQPTSLTALAQAVRVVNTYPADLASLITHEKIQMTLAEFTMPTVWKRVLEKSEFVARSEAIEAFNMTNLWKKRGIAITPVKYVVFFASIRLGFNMHCL